MYRIVLQLFILTNFELYLLSYMLFYSFVLVDASPLWILA